MWVGDIRQKQELNLFPFFRMALNFSRKSFHIVWFWFSFTSRVKCMQNSISPMRPNSSSWTCNQNPFAAEWAPSISLPLHLRAFSVHWFSMCDCLQHLWWAAGRSHPPNNTRTFSNGCSSLRAKIKIIKTISLSVVLFLFECILGWIRCDAKQYKRHQCEIEWSYAPCIVLETMDEWKAVSAHTGRIMNNALIDRRDVLQCSGGIVAAITFTR